MSFGVTSTGFVTKRQADIKTELEAALKSTFGPGVNLDDDSPLGQLVGILSEREALVWELAEGVYNSGYPDTAEGVPLDNIVSLTGVYRKTKTYSKVLAAVFLGTAGTIIPQGSIVSVAGNSAARFTTDVALTIAANVVEVQRITFDHVPTGGNWRITWNAIATSLLAYNAVAATIQTALRSIAGLSAATVTGDYTAGFTITYTGTVGDVVSASVTSSTLTYASGSVVATVATLTPGLPARAVGDLTAQVSGPVAAPAGSLSVIETPVSGWSSVSNPTDANVGDALETDDALKLRRTASVQKAGGGTAPAIRSDLLAVAGVAAVLVFENLNLTVDANSRPGKSFEAVVQGGLDADIAFAIFENKPAGIQSYGTTSIAVTDTQGIAHTVSFSRPTTKLIYCQVEITTDSTYPNNGDALVVTQMLAYGAGLGLGDDVIPAPAMMGFLAQISGITTAVIKVGLAPSPTLSANIAIATFELAAFDSSRITLVRT